MTCVLYARVGFTLHNTVDFLFMQDVILQIHLNKSVASSSHFWIPYALSPERIQTAGVCVV